MQGNGATVEDVLEKGAVVAAGGAAAIASSLDVRGPSGTSKVHPETPEGGKTKKKPRRIRSRVRSIRTKMERRAEEKYPRTVFFVVTMRLAFELVRYYADVIGDAQLMYQISGNDRLRVPFILMATFIGLQFLLGILGINAYLRIEHKLSYAVLVGVFMVSPPLVLAFDTLMLLYRPGERFLPGKLVIFMVQYEAVRKLTEVATYVNKTAMGLSLKEYIKHLMTMGAGLPLKAIKENKVREMDLSLRELTNAEVEELSMVMKANKSLKVLKLDWEKMSLRNQARFIGSGHAAIVECEEYMTTFYSGDLMVRLCEKGDLDLVKALVEGHDVEKTGMSVDKMVSKEGKSSRGISYTPLQTAAEKAVIDYLFGILLRDSNGVDTLTSVYKKALPKGTPLVCACEKGRLEDVRMLVEGHDVEKTGMSLDEMVSKEGKDSDGSSRIPLRIAVMKEQFEIVEYLVKTFNKVDLIGHTGSIGQSSLHLAASYSKKNVQMLQFLIDNYDGNIKEIIDEKNDYGRTPLDCAYHFNNSPIKKKIVSLLRKYGGKKASYYDKNGKNVGKGKGDLKRPGTAVHVKMCCRKTSRMAKIIPTGFRGICVSTTRAIGLMWRRGEDKSL
eukprot:g15271.t1